MVYQIVKFVIILGVCVFFASWRFKLIAINMPCFMQLGMHYLFFFVSSFPIVLCESRDVCYYESGYFVVARELVFLSLQELKVCPCPASIFFLVAGAELLRFFFLPEKKFCCEENGKVC